jgi:predicted ATP-grasp superfamily ATP-dependent carboligase
MVRAKFRVVRHEQAEGNVYHPSTEKYGPGVWHAVVLQAVINGSEENKQFYAATPSGEIKMSMVRADTAAQFPIGAEVYVDFTPIDNSQ